MIINNLTAIINKKVVLKDAIAKKQNAGKNIANVLMQKPNVIIYVSAKVVLIKHKVAYKAIKTKKS
jgi:hypothetical protein